MAVVMICSSFRLSTCQLQFITDSLTSITDSARSGDLGYQQAQKVSAVKTTIIFRSSPMQPISRVAKIFLILPLLALLSACGSDDMDKPDPNTKMLAINFDEGAAGWQA